MIGKNELRLCAAEMHKAMEDYLNSRVFKGEHGVKVTSIHETKEMSCQTFEIKFEEFEDEEE